MKRWFIAMALFLCLFAVSAEAQRNSGYVYHEVTVVDLNGKPVTDINEVYIYLPDTTTSQTVYLDRGLNDAITIPMTSSSTNTGLTQASGKIRWWGQDSYDFKIGNDTVTVSNAYTSAYDSSKGQIVFPYFLRTYDSQTLLDAQSITLGTDLDWVMNGGGVADSLVFTPATADTSVFSVGTNSYPADFRVFGATSGYDVYWDASEDTLEVLDNVTFAVGTGDDYTISHNGTTTTVAGAWTASGIPTFSTDAVFDGTYDIKYDDSRYQLHFQDNAVLGIGGAADAAGDVTFTHDGSDLIMDAAIADEGWLIGDTTSGFDITYKFETAGQFRTDYDGDFINLTDDMDLRFGTGASADGDFQISSGSGNVLAIEQVVSGTGTITVGADDKGIDMTWYAETASDYMKWDQDAATNVGGLIFEDSVIQMMDDTTIIFGDGSDGTLQYDEDGEDAMQWNNVAVYGAKTLVEVIGANDTLLAAESGKTIVVDGNDVAAGNVVLTLPTAAAGLIFTIMDVNTTAADDVWITAAAGDTINGGTAGKSYKCVTDAVKQCVTLLAVDATRWEVVSEVGTWANDNN